jgi:signal transduction histidine kinase
MVSDTGKGISPKDINKIFDPFFTTKEGGSGLGLSIVHKIVEIHGGNIAVESRHNRGTTFALTLPVS